jgi:hypothetical protein
MLETQSLINALTVGVPIAKGINLTHIRFHLKRPYIVIIKREQQHIHGQCNRSAIE